MQCVLHLCIQSSLTSDVREVLSSFPAVWANAGVPLVLIQAGIAVDSPTACHLVWGGRCKKADLTHQFVWWWVHKLAVIPSNLGSSGSCQFWPVQCQSHLLHMQRLNLKMSSTSVHNTDNTYVDTINLPVVADTVLQLQQYRLLARQMRSQVLF